MPSSRKARCRHRRWRPHGRRRRSRQVDLGAGVASCVEAQHVVFRQQGHKLGKNDPRT